MIYTLDTGAFDIKYSERETEGTLVWERHCHGAYELIAVLYGDVTVSLEGEHLRLRRGEGILIPPLLYHTVTVSGRDEYHRVTALFTEESIPAPLMDGWGAALRSVSVFHPRDAERLRDAVKGGASEPRLYAPLADALMVSTLYTAAQPRTEAPDTRVGRDGDGTDLLLRGAIEYIDAHLTERITLSDLCRHTSRSPSSFSHLFTARMHLSPGQYVLEKKLALAEKLIREGTPPTEAARRLGYDNYSSFYRLYKKHLGRPPRGR